MVSAGWARSGSRFTFSRDSATLPKRRTAIVNIATVTRRRTAREGRDMEER
jgi:hypothetical protein